MPSWVEMVQENQPSQIYSWDIPDYEVTSGSIVYQGKSLLEMEVYERARSGIFLSFQYPSVIGSTSWYIFEKIGQQHQRRTCAKCT